MSQTRAVRLVDIVKEYETQFGPKRVLDGINLSVGAGEKVAVLGRNGAGKSTLVRVLGGVEQPTRGHVERGLFMSWPLGFSGGIEGEMTGMDNIRFICKLYGKAVADVSAFVDDFAELGRQLYVPVRDYSSGMRARLAFALTLAIDFECFLIDEVTAVGDQRFQRRSHEELFIKRADRALILVSHDINAIRMYCSKAMVLKAGRCKIFEDLDLALKIYSTL
jgi:capsular polysaccharide transport system ATP-binding protein